MKENKKHQERNIGKKIKSVIKFVPSVIAQESFGSSIGKAVLHINDESKNSWKKQEQNTALFLLDLKEKYPTLKIDTFDLNINKKTSISSLEIKHLDNPNLSQNSDEGTIQTPRENIIVFMPNFHFCERALPNFCIMAIDYDANIISFNYRGKGNSTGVAKKLKDLVNDGKAQVDRLIAKGISPQNIVLYGLCFGGNVATIVANELHKENKKVYLFNDRSYTKISKLLTEQIKETKEMEKGIDDSKYNKIKQIVEKPATKVSSFIIGQTTSLTGWNENAAKAFLEIPDKYTDYIVVQNSKEVKKLAATTNLKLFDDGFIPEKASLHYFLKEKRKATKKLLKDELETISADVKSITQNKSSLNEKEDDTAKSLSKLKERETELQMELLKFKERKMLGTVNNNNDNYFTLQRKQTYIKMAQEKFNDIEDLLKMSNALDDINEKIKTAKDSETRQLIINERKDIIQSFDTKTYNGLNKSIWEILQSYPQKKKVTRKEFDDISAREFTDRDLITDIPNNNKLNIETRTIEDVISLMLKVSMRNYSKLVLKITGKEIKDSQDFYEINISNEGIYKINHNHSLKEIVSRVVKTTSGDKLANCEGKNPEELRYITGADYFKEFINNHRQQQRSTNFNKEMT